MCRNFCQTIKLFPENNTVESFFKSRGSLIKKYQVKKKVIKFSKKKNKNEIF